MLEHQPDIVLIGIRMPGWTAWRHPADPRGPAAAGCRIVMLTTFDLDQYVYAALTAGASGFLLGRLAEQLVDTVRTVAPGDALLAPSITRRLVEQFASAASAPPVVHRELSS